MPEPRWKPIHPVGLPAAIDSMGSVAAPLLASVAIAVIVFVATTPDSVRWPNLTMGLLLGALISLVATIQFTFRARCYAVTPSQIEEWWPLDDDATKTYRRQMQRYHYNEFQTWMNLARRGYNVGLLLLAASMATIVYPKGTTVSHLTGGEWTVLVLALLGLVAEALWIVVGWFRRNTKPTLPTVDAEFRGT